MWLRTAFAATIVGCTYPALPRLSSDAPADDSLVGDATIADAPTSSRYQSCIGLANNCGSNGNDDCCAQAMTISGGTFYREQDAASPNMNYPATVSSFTLDKYEVTVGRFRKFVHAGAGTRAFAPHPGAGEHALIQGSGWDSSWDTSLSADTPALVLGLKCSPEHQTWTDALGANETLPINCINWFEAMAFCIWDGGYLPTLAESKYASAGGSESRAYPWSPSTSPATTTIDCSYANYGPDVGIHCVNGAVGGADRVGNQSPKGDGKWGHADLAGNVDEWVLDWYAFPLTVPCNDCANLSPGTHRAKSGGSFKGAEANLRVSSMSGAAPDSRSYGFIGVRCARTP